MSLEMIVTCSVTETEAPGDIYNFMLIYAETL